MFVFRFYLFSIILKKKEKKKQEASIILKFSDLVIDLFFFFLDRRKPQFDVFFHQIKSRTETTQNLMSRIISLSKQKSLTQFENSSFAHSFKLIKTSYVALQKII